MARRKRKRELTPSRIFGVFLLLLVFLVMLAGIWTAVYLERSHDFRVAVISQTPNEPSSAIVAVSAPPARALATLEPSATGASLPPMPVNTLARAPQPRQSPQFWVEYGVFAAPVYAHRLRQTLRELGLEATVSSARTPAGRHLLRVRSAPLAEYAAARAAAKSAQKILKITALIHRVVPERGGVSAVAPTADSTGRHYWVQFGTFLHLHQAERLHNLLAQGGIQTSVSFLRGPDHKYLYYIRSWPLTDRGSATSLAYRGRQVTKAGALIRRSHPRPRSTLSHREPHSPPPAVPSTG